MAIEAGGADAMPAGHQLEPLRALDHLDGRPLATGAKIGGQGLDPVGVLGTTARQNVQQVERYFAMFGSQCFSQVDAP